MAVFGIDVHEGHIRLLPQGINKEQALSELVDAMAANPVISDPATFREKLLAREAQGSTGIGGGIAIPHLRHESVVQPALGVAVVPDGLDFGASDGQPVHIIVLFAIPAGQDKLYLNLLAQVMLALRNKTLYDQFLTCTTVSQIAELLNR